ncbi:MAG: glutathione S-transferase family protein [Pseudomonadota bacterium]
MADIKLYFFPRACSGVALAGLIQSGMPFNTQLINIFKREQYAPEYMKNVHRGGKVPALVVDGVPVTENASIQMLLNEMAPDAGLMPKTDDLLEKARQRSDLIWCSSTLHPFARMVRLPMRFSEKDAKGVYEFGTKVLLQNMVEIEARIKDGGWWYGEHWSLVDVYVNWCLITAASNGLPLDDFPGIRDHMRRVQEIPAVKEARKIEHQAIEEHGIEYPA